jgi:hypothetical protein
MVGVGDSPLAARQQATHISPLRFLLLLSSTSLLGIFFVSCGGPRIVAGGGASNFSDCSSDPACYTSCSDVCDASCSNYSPSACTNSGSNGSGTTDPGGGTSSGCTDAADPSCGNYDPPGFDGGGSGDGGCDTDSCSDPGDPGGGTGDTGGGNGVGSGDTGNDGDTGGDPGDDGGDMIIVDAGSQHLAPHSGHAQSVAGSNLAFSKLMADRLPSLAIARKAQTAHFASDSRQGEQDEIAY